MVEERGFYRDLIVLQPLLPHRVSAAMRVMTMMLSKDISHASAYQHVFAIGAFLSPHVFHHSCASEKLANKSELNLTFLLS